MRFFVYFPASLLILAGCRDGPPDVGGIQVRLEVRRFDSAFAALDTAALGPGLQRLAAQYPEFLNFYLDTLTGLEVRGAYTDSAALARVRPFLSHPDLRALSDTLPRAFPDVSATTAAVTEALRYYKHYFPRRPSPTRLVYFNSYTDYKAITYGDDLLGVGLDMYLGPDYRAYLAKAQPAYETRRRMPAYIPVDLLRAYHAAAYPFDPGGDRVLLDLMIQRGKEQYVLKKVFPQAPDSLLMGYTGTQWQWCTENEGPVFNFFIQHDLLYESNLQQITRYVTDGPTTGGMPPESPGNIGTFVGLRIVEHWMENHPDTPLETLMQPADAQKFLQESGYKPR